jgi:hypothetical protein
MYIPGQSVDAARSDTVVAHSALAGLNMLVS